MTYPPMPHTETDPQNMIALAKKHPFAHIFTTNENGQHVTRLPFITDTKDGEIVALRAHLNAQNPQAATLSNAKALIAFSGPDTYISPNWRIDKGRGATWDYTALHIWGTITVKEDPAFFKTLINDLAAEAEPQFDEIAQGQYWSIEDAPEGYVQRLIPHLKAFEVKVERIDAISKLHQDFPIEDAMSVAQHLERSNNHNGQIVGSMIQERANIRRKKQQR
jgi:transcriptional regulator